MIRALSSRGGTVRFSERRTSRLATASIH
jgi:hypothetical protein